MPDSDSIPDFNRSGIPVRFGAGGASLIWSSSSSSERALRHPRTACGRLARGRPARSRVGAAPPDPRVRSTSVPDCHVLVVASATSSSSRHGRALHQIVEDQAGRHDEQPDTEQHQQPHGDLARVAGGGHLPPAGSARVDGRRVVIDVRLLLRDRRATTEAARRRLVVRLAAVAAVDGRPRPRATDRPGNAVRRRPRVRWVRSRASDSGRPRPAAALPEHGARQWSQKRSARSSPITAGSSSRSPHHGQCSTLVIGSCWMSLIAPPESSVRGRRSGRGRGGTARRHAARVRRSPAGRPRSASVGPITRIVTGGAGGSSTSSSPSGVDWRSARVGPGRR